MTLDALTEYNLANRIIPLRDGTQVLDYLYHRGAFADDPPGKPALILLDLKLPKLDGIDVLRQIKQDPNLATTPVIVLAGPTNPGVSTPATSSGPTRTW